MAITKLGDRPENPTLDEALCNYWAPPRKYEVLWEGSRAYYKLLDNEDYVLEALAIAVQNKTGCSLSLDKAIKFVKTLAKRPSNDMCILYAGNCYIMVSLGTSWYSDDLYLYEDFLVTVDQANFKRAVEGLVEFAKDNNAKGVLIGTLANRRDIAYGRLLEMNGFKQVAQEYLLHLKE